MTLGWRRGPLIDFAELVSTGPFGSMLHKSDYVSDGVPLINPTNIVGETIFPDGEKQVGVEALSRLSSYVLKAGDVVVGRRGEIGRCAVVGANEAGWVCGTGCFFIRPGLAIDSHFLAWLLRSPDYRAQLERASTGATMKNMSNITLAQLPVAIPEIAEQRRIVAILDEAFEAIAAAKARVEESLEKLDELFENAMRWVLKHPGVHLTHIAMGEVCEIRSKLVDPREDPYLDQPHVGAGNITSKTGELVDVLTARQEQLISGKFEFDDSMVLYSKIRPYLMKVVRPDFSGLCSADVYPLVPKPGVITRDFLYYTLLSSVFTDYAIKGSARVGMPKVNRDHLFAYQMSLPSVEVQGQITQKLDALSDNVKKVRGIYTRKLAALDELKKSLLDQAFSGQLTSSKPLPVVQPQALQTATPQFTANVIALAYTRHEKQKREKTFGHVKEQKVLHLVEAIAKVDLGRHPMKDAAGPNDFPHMLRAEQWAKEQSFFEMVERDKGYDFKRLKDFDKCLARARQELGPYLSQIEAAIDLLVPMDTEEAEVFVTVHAAWNNLLMDGAEATDSAILREARDTWHPAKLAIAEHKFKKAIKLVRRKNLVPDGTGKYVAGQKSLPL